MPRLDELPPDLRATLSLLVDRGKSYAEVADMLGISQDAVRDRAHAAIDALADDPDDQNARGAYAPQSLPASPTRTTTLPASRRAGAILLACIVAVVVVAIVLITGSGGSSSHKSHSSTSTTSTSSATGTKSSTSKTPTVDTTLKLTSPEPSSKTVGVVEVLSEGSKRAFYMAAEHLPPSKGFFYAIWLYNSPSSAEAISKSPAVGPNERLQGGALLPTNAGEYHEILLTRETSEHVGTTPGPVVLHSTFSLGS